MNFKTKYVTWKFRILCWRKGWVPFHLYFLILYMTSFNYIFTWTFKLVICLFLVNIKKRNVYWDMFLLYSYKDLKVFVAVSSIFYVNMKLELLTCVFLNAIQVEFRLNESHHSIEFQLNTVVPFIVKYCQF